MLDEILCHAWWDIASWYDAYSIMIYCDDYCIFQDIAMIIAYSMIYYISDLTWIHIAQHSYCSTYMRTFTLLYYVLLMYSRTFTLFNLHRSRTFTLLNLHCSSNILVSIWRDLLTIYSISFQSASATREPNQPILTMSFDTMYTHVLLHLCCVSLWT